MLISIHFAVQFFFCCFERFVSIARARAFHLKIHFNDVEFLLGETERMRQIIRKSRENSFVVIASHSLLAETERKWKRMC